MMNTNVIRTVRNGSTVTGVEVETAEGQRVIYNVNAGGAVLLAAGALSTPRILFNSGIGPVEQLRIVATGTSGVTLPAEGEWIDLPVGTEVKDHPIFTIKFDTSTSMTATSKTSFTQPDQTTVDLFAKGAGMLARSGQRLNWWSSVNTTDGTEVFFQGTCNGPADNTIQMKVYITHGLQSVGTLEITAGGATTFGTNPHMNSDVDTEAITLMMNRLIEMTHGGNSTLSLIAPTGVTNVTGADLIKEFKTGSHYVGTAKMGAKGEAGVVVDTDTKVYGTDNLFVVDASMHPDLPTGNTQAIVMVAAEAAAARILAVRSRGANNTTVSMVPEATSTVTVPNGTGSAVVPISAPVHSTAPAESASAAPTEPALASPTESSPAAAPTASESVKPYDRCGGIGYGGSTQCVPGWTCVVQNDYYSQCLARTNSRRGKSVHASRQPSQIARRNLNANVKRLVGPDAMNSEQAVRKASYLDTYDV